MCTEYGVRYTAITDQRSGSPSGTAQHTGPTYTPYAQQRRAIVHRQLCVGMLHARARIVQYLYYSRERGQFHDLVENEKSTTWTPSTLRRSAWCWSRPTRGQRSACTSVAPLLPLSRASPASHAGFECCTYRSFPPPRGSSLGCDSNCHPVPAQRQPPTSNLFEQRRGVTGSACF